MKKSGLADSPFFTPPPKKAQTPPSPKEKTTEQEVKELKKKETKPKSSNHDVMTSRNHAVKQSVMQSRHHDAIIEVIRKAVRIIGKEPSTHRMTPEEKRAIVDIVYAYKMQGVRTTENEIARIAINFLVEDYKENGENSVLHQVLQALNE